MPLDKLPIFHFSFDDQYSLTSTFLRFQEHYESPVFAGKTFTLEEFSDWYATTAVSRTMSYYQDWSGFNFPSYVLHAFQNGGFHPLSRKEIALINTIENRASDKDIDFYVIGTHKENDEVVILHEIIHGIYYINKEYAERVNSIVESHDLTNFKSAIINMGYRNEVLNDECNAYMTTGLATQLFGIDDDEVLKCTFELKELIKTTLKFDVDDENDKSMLESLITTINMKMVTKKHDVVFSSKVDFWTKLEVSSE